MKKLLFKININANAGHVFDTMLGLTNKSTYERWAALFNPTSTYEGTWNKGSRIYFVGINSQGEKEGLVSEIIENNPHKFVSVKHLGIVHAGREILNGPEIEAWAGSVENYTFEEGDGRTRLTVTLDTTEEFADQMKDVYPVALEKLKEICEETTSAQMQATKKMGTTKWI